MGKSRSRVGMVLVGIIALTLFPAPARAQEREELRGCVVERTPTSITITPDKRQMLLIGTAWLDSEGLDAAQAECVTVKAVRLANGDLMAESIEAGDEPNEINSLTEETTRDRERQHPPDEEDDD